MAVPSAYGLTFVSPYLSANSESSSKSFVPVRSNFDSFRIYFSGLNSGVSGGVTLLLNSLSGASVTFATIAFAVPSCETMTVTVATMVSYVTVASVPATSRTV